MNLFRPMITEDDKYILKNSGIWDYLVLAAESYQHEANNFLLAGAHFLGTFNGHQSNEVVLKMFNNIMYSRLYYCESSGYTISDSEKKALIALQSKIDDAATKYGKTKEDISERINILIINILINKEWWIPG